MGLPCLGCTTHTAADEAALASFQDQVHQLFPVGSLAGTTPDGAACTVQFSYVEYFRKFSDAGAAFTVRAGGDQATFTAFGGTNDLHVDRASAAAR